MPAAKKPRPRASMTMSNMKCSLSRLFRVRNFCAFCGKATCDGSIADRMATRPYPYQWP